jgi:hypothetical protein
LANKDGEEKMGLGFTAEEDENQKKD